MLVLSFSRLSKGSLHSPLKPSGNEPSKVVIEVFCACVRSTPLEVSDVAVGKQRQQYMHTISAGPANAPPMVLVPGYGAGAAFYFRNLDGLAAHFRTHAVDLLGTGMSGAWFTSR